ncbi:MAG: hypothetical protein NXH75_17815 [Halobacteriovoraceae bacterium]|nr:hypothetical protein [Halobacteriovoraceae bacterium]
MKKCLTFISLLFIIIPSLLAQDLTITTIEDSFRGVKFPSIDVSEPNRVETRRIKPSEIEVEHFNSLPHFFSPSYGSLEKRVEPTIPQDDEYEEFIQNGINSDNLEKYLSGDFEGNGGHPALGRIHQYKKDIYKILKVTDDDHGKFEVYSNIKNSIRIICSPVPLRANGSFVIAKNFPHSISPTIYFDCDQFMNFEADDQRLLVFHEILPLIGLLDRDYELSNYLIDLSLKFLPAVL